MMPEILVLPRQNNDNFKNEVRRKLNEQFRFLLDCSITIVFYKPQGRPLDGLEENLSPVLRSGERKPHEDAVSYLLIIAHDTYIPLDRKSSLEREWNCKVFQWRTDADWKTICQYLERFMEKKKKKEKKKSNLESIYDCVQRYVPAMKRAIFPLCSAVLIYVSFRLFQKIISSDPIPSPSDLASPASSPPPLTSSASPCSGRASLGYVYETTKQLMKKHWIKLISFVFDDRINFFLTE